MINCKAIYTQEFNTDTYNSTENHGSIKAGVPVLPLQVLVYLCPLLQLTGIPVMCDLRTILATQVPQNGNTKM